MNLQESIRRILREQQTTVPIRARRRLVLIDQILKLKISNYYGPDKICKYETADELVEVIAESVIETMFYSHYFGDIDDDSDEWEIISDYMEKYINDNYGEKLREYYHINCGD